MGDGMGERCGDGMARGVRVVMVGCDVGYCSGGSDSGGHRGCVVIVVVTVMVNVYSNGYSNDYSNCYIIG